MAKTNNLLNLEGTIGGMTFYKAKDGKYLVRTKGGVSKSRIQNDPNYARTRENGSEFGHIASSSKQLRRAINPLLADVRDPKAHNRLTATLSKVKNLDSTSIRGQRNVANGLQTDLGKQLLDKFDFNSNATLDNVLLAAYQLEEQTGQVTISNLNPAQGLKTTIGATHTSFCTAVLQLDFSTDNSECIVCPEEVIPINNSPVDVILTPPAIPTGTGTRFHLIKIAFLQEVNNTLYPLNNGAHNVLQIIKVV